MRRVPLQSVSVVEGRMRWALAATATFVLLGGCATSRPTADAPATTASTLPFGATAAWGAIDEAEATPLVQVRDFWRARTVSVLGFYKENATYGLRAEVRHDGQLTSNRRLGDHLLYMNRAIVRANGGFKLASIMTSELQLVPGALRDVNSCLLGLPCSPYDNVTLGIPDSVLRSYRNGLVVTFDRDSPSQWIIEFSSEMIAKYLNSVDSVIVARRTN